MRATTHSKMEYDVCQGLEIRVGTKGDGWKKGTKGGRGSKGVVVAVAGDLELGAVGLLLSEQ